jgi:hypothetical protein
MICSKKKHLFSILLPQKQSEANQQLQNYTTATIPINLYFMAKCVYLQCIAVAEATENFWA